MKRKNDMVLEQNSDNLCFHNFFRIFYGNFFDFCSTNVLKGWCRSFGFESFEEFSCREIWLAHIFEKLWIGGNDGLHCFHNDQSFSWWELGTFLAFAVIPL